jgi:hypothetical protein
VRRTFESSEYHSHAIVTIQVFDLFAYQACEKAGVEGIGCGRVDLDKRWELCLGFASGLGVEKIDD